MKDALIWLLILTGPVLAIIGMRRNRVPWNTSRGLVALAAAVVTLVVGFLLLRF